MNKQQTRVQHLSPVSPPYTTLNFSAGVTYISGREKGRIACAHGVPDEETEDFTLNYWEAAVSQAYN